MLCPVLKEKTISETQEKEKKDDMLNFLKVTESNCNKKIRKVNNSHKLSRFFEKNDAKVNSMASQQVVSAQNGIVQVTIVI